MKFLIIFLIYALAISLSLAFTWLRSSSNKSPKSSQKQAKKLLIIGGTGGTGRQLVEQALEWGYVVTALVRNPSKLKVEHAQLKILRGNVLNYESFEVAVCGQDAVISALGQKKFFCPTWVLSDGTRNLLRAIEPQDVPCLVCETSLGTGNSVEWTGLYDTLFVISVLSPFYFWDRTTRQGNLISDSKLKWVMVHPGILKNRKKRGEYRHGNDIGNFLGL